MNKETLQHRAYSIYAAIGELTLRKKQMHQQIEEVDSKLEALELEIVKLSQAQSDNEDEKAKEGVHNVD
jgi:hypothetical protein